MDGTILSQGTFRANLVNATGTITAANPTVIQIPSGADWVKVYNYTQQGTVGTTTATFNGTANASVGSYFYWQRGMAPGTGMVWYKGAANAIVDADTFNLTSVSGGGGGFTLYDPSGTDPQALPLLGAAVAFSAITNAAQPVLTVTSTAGVSVGSVVRLSILSGDTAAINNIAGMNFVVGAVVANTSITLLTAASAFPANPGITTGTGHYRIVNYSALYYPRARAITNITQAVNATVSTAQAHGMTPGQELTFNIPSVSGMVELNSTQANNFRRVTVATVVDDYDFTINLDTTSYTAFSYPTVAQQPSSFPSFTPMGEDTAYALSSNTSQVPTIGGLQINNTNTGILADATVNTGFLGMILGSGGRGVALATPIIGPAGTTTSSVPDTIYWVAGKASFGGL